MSSPDADAKLAEIPLDELERLEQRATQGPWVQRGNYTLALSSQPSAWAVAEFHHALVTHDEEALCNVKFTGLLRTHATAIFAALRSLTERLEQYEYDRADTAKLLLDTADHIVSLEKTASEALQECEGLRAVLNALLAAMDAEAIATLKSERMRENGAAFDEPELTIADNATVDAICTTSEAMNAARRALGEPNE